MKRRLLKRLFIGIFSVALLLSLGLFVVLGTQTGSRFVFDQARGLTGDRLDAERIDGSLLFGFEIHSLVWQQPGTTVRLSRLESEIGFWPLLIATINVKPTQAENLDIHLESSNTNQTSDDPFELSLPFVLQLDSLNVSGVRVSQAETVVEVDQVALKASYQDDQLIVSEAKVLSPWLKVDLQGQGQTSGKYPLQAELGWSVGKDFEWQAEGRLVVSGDADRLMMGHDLKTPVEVQSRGSLQPKDNWYLDLNNAWNGIDYPWDSQAILRNITGELDLSGNIGSLNGRFDTRFDWRNLSGVELGMKANQTASGLKVTQIQLDSDLLDGQFQGVVDVLSTGVEWTGELLLEVIDGELLENPLQGKGFIVTQGRLVDWESLSGSAEIQALEGRFLDKEFDGKGSLKYEEKLELTDLRFDVGDNSLRLNGVLGADSNLRGTLQAPQLQQLDPTWTGSARAEFVLTGAIQNPNLRFNAEGTNVSMGQISADDAQISADIKNDRDGSVDLDFRSVTINQQTLDTVMVNISGGLDAQKATAWVEKDGFNGQITAEGTFQDKTWTGQLQEAVFKGPDIETWSLSEPANIRLSETNQTLTQSCVGASEEKKICLSLNSDTSTATSDLVLSVGALPIKPFVTFLVDKPDVTGRVNGQANLSLRDGEANGQYQLSLQEGRVTTGESGETSFAELPLSVELTGDISNNQLSSNLQLTAGQATACLTAEVSDVTNAETSPINVNVNIQSEELKILSDLFPTIEFEGGQMNGEITALGTLHQPELSGSLDVSELDIFVMTSGIQYRDVSLTVTPETTQRFLLDLKGQAGNGILSASGALMITEADGWYLDSVIQGSDVDIANLPNFKMQANPDLSLYLNQERLKLSGSIHLPSASIAIDQLPESAVTSSPDAVVCRDVVNEPADVFAYEYDVRVTLGESVSLSGFGLNGRLEGGMDVSGDEKEGPNGVGTLETKDATFAAYGQQLEIERGRLTFSGDFSNPLLDLRATRSIDDVMVGINVSGSASQPNSTLFSQPAMPSAAALSYLITGRPLDQSTNQEGDLASAAIALGLSKSLTSELKAKVGLDELSVAGRSGDSRLLAGKRLTQKLYLQYAYGIFDRVGSVLVRFQVSDRLLLESESGTEQSLDLIYSVERD